MASRIFGSTAARLRFLRPTTIASASAKSVGGGFAAWKILAAASSSYAVGSVCSDNATVETAETTETETVTETTRARATTGERTGRDDGRANVSAIPHLYRQWKATILPMVTTTTMMMTTVCEANDVPEAEVEAALKSSMIASKEESNERREQRHKFLQKKPSHQHQRQCQTETHSPADDQRGTVFARQRNRTKPIGSSFGLGHDGPSLFCKGFLSSLPRAQGLRNAPEVWCPIGRH